MDTENRRAVDKAVDQLLQEFPPASTDPVKFLRAQFDAGLAYVWNPPGFGGLGLALELQQVIDTRLETAGAPPSGRVTNAIAAGQGAATILAYGSEDQKRRYLRPLFTAELMGCQLYSEPGSGSDLASLATRAVRDGDEWVVDGQKVWTSGAQRADIAILLTRTDPNLPKHAGLTQFVIDMHQPGVEVRPLRQMSGAAEFNEVFLTAVRVPDSERLGDVNDGWAVSQHTLLAERYNMPQVAGRGEGAIALAVEAWQRREDKTSATARALRAELMRHWVENEVLRLLQMRATERACPGHRGPGGFPRETGGVHHPAPPPRVGARPARPRGRRSCRPDTTQRPPILAACAEWLRTSAAACVGSPGIAIAGGTDQIQRNIIGDRVLGLPREPAVDRGSGLEPDPSQLTTQ